MTVFDWTWLIPMLPLLGAFLLGVRGRRMTNSGVYAIGIGSVSLSFVIALLTATAYVSQSTEGAPILLDYFTWFQAGSLQVKASFYLDPLALLMALVVTGVGLLIHIYSIGYMAHDAGRYRFFAYLNLFMFFMLLLVLAGNYLLLFVGWEGVGLCSYLLIGFWFHKKSAADAGKKAFIVNRIGDFGFTLALLLLFWTFGSLDYATIFSRATTLPVEPLAPAQAGLLTAITLLLFAGAVGKSAQLPLYVWLPDAMEGPTPVSALIHAATMVAAGVYMVARSHVLFAHAPFTLTIVAAIGCLTAFYAATIALVQTDIKRVLAYSTVSQLGYMFLGLGAGAFAAGIFHLMTHAFFKALLFLAAGSVIHAMHGQQDIRKMGGLRKKIPTTYWTFLAATLAIVGVPGFSGFFSKDEILWKTYTSTSLYLAPVWWLIGVVAAGMTSFYMFRLIFLTFHGEGRYTPETARTIHESPRVMTVPLAILAALSIVGGWVGIPPALGHLFQVPNLLEEFLEPVFAASHALLPAAAEAASHGQELGWMGLTVLVAGAGLLVAYVFYLRIPEWPSEAAARFSLLYRVLTRKYYVDEIYDVLVVSPLHWLSERVFWQAVDVGLIDGAVDGAAERARGAGLWARRLQSGNVRSYGAWVVIGVLVVLSYFAFDLGVRR